MDEETLLNLKGASEILEPGASVKEYIFERNLIETPPPGRRGANSPRSIKSAKKLPDEQNQGYLEVSPIDVEKNISFPSQSTSSRLRVHSEINSHSHKFISSIDTLERTRSVGEGLPEINAPSALSWLERTNRFSVSEKGRRRSNSSQESRKIVDQYDSRKSLNLRDYEIFKHGKWGEDQLSEINLDPSDIDIDLSLTDTLGILPLTDSVAKCVKSYYKYFSNTQCPRVRHALQPLPELPSESESLEPAPLLHVSQNQRSNVDEEFPGDVAVPSEVQSVFDISADFRSPKQTSIRTIFYSPCPHRKKDLVCPQRQHAYGYSPCPSRASKICPKRKGA